MAALDVVTALNARKHTAQRALTRLCQSLRHLTGDAHRCALALMRHRDAVLHMSPNVHSSDRVSSALQGRDTPMKSSAIIASVIIALSTGAAVAQSGSFDARKFFERFEAEGASMPANFDARKFFDQLQLDGASSSKPLSAEEFFEKLRAEGASVPTQFDSKAFISKVRSEGMLPPVVAVPKQ